MDSIAEVSNMHLDNLNIKCKLVMTLLVRNEEDIIRENIEFHLKNGVDFIIATDNASTDNSRAILAEYQQMGKLFLIDEPGRDKSQAAWNNRMTKIAIDKYGADIVFHCDADELWYPVIGDLKTEISNSQNDVMSVSLINIILEKNKGEESLKENVSYAVIKPIETSNYEEETKNNNLFFYKYPPKVIFKAGKGLLEVDQGNHNVINLNKNISKGASRNIFILHFPLRGKQRFYQKVAATGMAVEKNRLLSKGQSFHIRRWFDAYKTGTLDKEYEKLTISKHQAEKLKRIGFLEDFYFSMFINNQKNDNLIYQIQKNKIDFEITCLRQTIVERDRQIAILNQALDDRDCKIAILNQDLIDRNEQIAELYDSTSWRITSPLRMVAHLLKGIMRYKTGCY